ncbi:hypothetical protein [Burkholderia sp. LMG 13014]|uniref:hypothetical protein n=1 Tax=Burkholderia sp. LMG 13014 TaxID=2709306 RepID=UPI001963D836|nr:hypothetical protein [Burkholderia sp. LMG 13014]
MDKTYCVWSLGEVITADGEPEFDSNGHLTFRRQDGTTSAIFSVWNALRIQDKE